MPQSISHSPTADSGLPSVGMAKRLAALLYDSLLVIALWMVVSAIALVLNNNEVVGGWLFNSALLTTSFMFFCKFWLSGGQTAGMRAWRVKLVRIDGGPLTFTDCVLRFVGATLCFASLGLGYLWALVDKDRLTWHDRYSGTRLVSLPKPLKSKS